jgi:outer membrane protein assembly factor BamD (BamD/ComL family)
MLRAFHALMRAARAALSVSIFIGAMAGVSFLSGCSEQPEQQSSPQSESPSNALLRDADESNWAQAVRTGSLGAFTDYLQNFPNGKHVAEARERIAALNAQARSDADEKAWTEARQVDTAAAYADYLRDFPAGAHAAQARERQAALDQEARGAADEKSWAEALRLATQVSLRDYLRQFPNGAHAAEARQRLAVLEQQARKQADENAWIEAERSGSLAALQDYLRDFPNGAHAAQARQRIAALNAGPPAEAKVGTGDDKKDAASKAKPKRALRQAGTTGPGARLVNKAPPSTSSNPWFRPFWQSLFPAPSK